MPVTDNSKTDLTALRLQLRKAGFHPLPLEGKAPHMAGWQQKFNVSGDEIRLWAKTYHLAQNTGVLAKDAPGCDIDITDDAAAYAVEVLAREHFEERGDIHMRFGNPPKRLIPLRTDEPFTKLSRAFIAPNGKEQKIEILGDGQQYVVDGIHPDTHKPYGWFGGDLKTIKREDLPYVRREDMEQFLDAAAKLLVKEFGFVEKGGNAGALPHVNGAPPTAAEAEATPQTPYSFAEEARLRAALQAIPADEKILAEKLGSSHDTWVKIGRAIERLDWGEKGFAIWRDWSAQNAKEFDEKGLRTQWGSFRRNRNTRANPVTIATVYHLAKQFGWVEPQPPRAEDRPGLGEWDGGEVDDNVSPREWLLGNVFCRGFVSSIIGDGAVGKTATRHAQLLSLAVGRSLTGEHVFQRCRVLMISLEDDDKELKRRIRAARLYHQIEQDELKGWLFVAAPGRSAGKLLTVDKDGRLVTAGLAEKIEKVIQERRIDIVSLDPFIKSHAVSENDNNAIDAVVEILTQLAAKYDIAVDVPHHISKGQADPGNANRGRGASSMKDAARLVYTLTPMSLEEAKSFGLDEAMRRSLIRMDSGKVNITPPMTEAKWFRLVGVPLGNGTELYPNGDLVQTVEPWTPPDKWAGLTHHLLNQILTDIDAGLQDGNRYTDSPNAGARAAWRVVIKHAPNKSEADAKGIIKAWVKSGLLVSEEYTSPTTRQKIKGVRVDDSKRPS
jgi:AAA domain/Primase C terminal 2 (PriCT-2)/Bifunctional DNA primase/polymerase, N-terminal